MVMATLSPISPSALLELPGFDRIVVGRTADDRYGYATESTLTGAISLSSFGAVGDGVTNDAPALLAAMTSGAKRVVGAEGATYYLASTVKVTGLQDVTLDLCGAAIKQGPLALPGIYFAAGCENCHIVNGRVIGNWAEAGDYEGIFTTGGITDGDTVGAASTGYSGVSTITITGLGTGWVRAGDRLSYITAGQVYGYIVQANAAITAGSATVTLDRTLDVAITAGQTLWIDQGARRFTTAAAYSAGVSTITIGAAAVTSPAGTPVVKAGDQFCFHTDYNEPNSIDYSTIYTVTSATAFSGSYPDVTCQITFTPALPASVPLGTRITSIQDYRNNKHSLVLFYGTTNCSARNLQVSGAQLHSIAFNATVRTPWDGSDPATVPNTGAAILDCSDESGKQGSAFVAAHAKGIRISGTVARGVTIRNAVQLEACEDIIITETQGYGMKTGVMVTGECKKSVITANMLKGCQIGIEQRNVCRENLIVSNVVENDPAFSLYGIKVEAGYRDESLEETTFNSLANVQGNVVSGRCLVSGSYNGSSILIQPPTASTTGSNSLRPHYVSVIHNTISYAGRHGIEFLRGVRGRIEGNTIFHAGYRGISIINPEDVDVVGNFVIDAGETVPSAAFAIDGGTGIIFSRNRAAVDASTGQTWGLEVLNTPSFRRYDANDMRGTVATNRVSVTDPVSTVRMGFRTLENLAADGVRNSALGALAGRQVTSGDNNTMLGYAAGQTATTGNRNTLIGANADVDAGSRSNAIAIGWGAIAKANGEIAIGDDAGATNGVATVTSATAGAATALPAQPLGYLVVRINGTPARVPFYAA